MDAHRRGVLKTLGLLAGATGAAADAAGPPLRSYLVRLVEPPVLAYTGGIDALAPTQPAPGQAFDADSPAVKAYVAYLELRQAAVLAGLGGSVRPLHRYTLTTNGFAVVLGEEQAARLRQTPGVAAVEATTARRLDPPPSAR